MTNRPRKPRALPRSSSAQRGYGYAWRKARELFLKLNPLCRFHELRGETVAATVVDHIRPHKGDQALMWDRSNWQSLCKHCHDATKQQMEKRGYATDIGVDGMPIDPKHPVHQGHALPRPSAEKTREFHKLAA